MPDAAKSIFQGLFKLGMRTNNNFSEEFFPGLMSVYAEGRVRVDNNQLQDQLWDPFVMIEQGFKSNLKAKYAQENSDLTSQCFIIIFMAILSHI